MVGAALVIAALAAAAVDDLRAYEGLARSRRDDTPLYLEQHWLWRDGDVEQRLVIYRCTDGHAFARKHVRAVGASQAPAFELVDARLAYSEGASGTGARREVYVERDGKRRTVTLDVPADGIIDAGFDRFLVAQWDALARGETPVIPFLVPSEQRFYPFRVRRLSDDAARGETRFRLSLSAWYGFLAPAMDVTYDRTTRELRHYAGLSNIRDVDGENLDVRIDFPADRVRRSGVDASEIDAADAEPLTGRCPLR